MNYSKADQIATKRSKENPDQLFYIIRIDHQDERTYAICKEDYLDTDEFIAFDGRVIDEYFNGKLNY
jgi:hypothetical protein